MNEITLSRPVDHNGVKYDKITIDEPTLAGVEAYQDAITAGKSEISGTIAMLAADTGWSEEALRKIRTGDFKKIAEALVPFVGEDGNTGEA